MADHDIVDPGKPRLWNRMSGSEVALCTATGTPSTVTGASPG